MRAAVEAAVRRLTAEEIGQNPEALQICLSPKELGIDSLSRLEILSRLEDEFGLELAPGTLSETTPLEELISIAAELVESQS